MDAASLTRFDELLTIFRSLNPDRVRLVAEELEALCRSDLELALPRLFALGDELVIAYVASPVKHNEAETLREYYYFLDGAAQKLIAAGKLTDAPPAPVRPTLALVPDKFWSALQWCTLTSQAPIPYEVSAAVDAAQRRNLLVDSVLEPLFTLLLRLAPAAAFTWQLALAARRDPALDPDIARDLVRVWAKQHELPAAVLRQVFTWSEDPAVFRHWPAVPLEADRLLRVHGLRRWAQHPAAVGEGVHLQRLAPFWDEDKLRRWLERATDAMGTCVDFFCDQSDKLSQTEPGGFEPWRHEALLREVVWLHHMWPPMLVLADLLFSTPAGAHQFGLALFGLTGDARQQWRVRLEANSHKVVRRVFLTDMKHGRTPEQSIHTLCFGDADLEAELLRELDLLSKQFDSVSQREKVTARLAAVYSDFREPALLNQEIGRRYRRLMRVLHEDTLRRVLTAEQWAQVAPLSEVLLDLAVIAATSRKYLAMRRALDQTTEAIIASEMEFVQSVRQVRTRQLHRLIAAAAAG